MLLRHVLLGAEAACCPYLILVGAVRPLEARSRTARGPLEDRWSRHGGPLGSTDRRPYHALHVCEISASASGLAASGGREVPGGSQRALPGHLEGQNLILPGSSTCTGAVGVWSGP